MYIKISPNKLIIDLLMLFPISTLIQTIGVFSYVNRVLIALMIILLFYVDFISNVSVKSYLVLGATVISYYVAAKSTIGELYRINDVFYLIFWILFFIFLILYKTDFLSYLGKQIDYLVVISKVWNVLVFISLFVPSSYSNLWGGEGYFAPYGSGPHRFASTCILMLSITLIIYKETRDRKMLIYALLPAISILLTGARTYLLVLIVYLVTFLYNIIENKKLFWKILIPIVTVLVLAIAISPVGKKILYQSSYVSYYGGELGGLTNGRSVFWLADIEAFINSKIVNVIFGNGFNFVYDVNYMAISDKIWAHNDFINLLLNFGIVGLFVYLITLISFVKKYASKNFLSSLCVIGFIACWFFNAMFNMVYTYVCATIALPFMLYSLFPFEGEERLNESVDNTTISRKNKFK